MKKSIKTLSIIVIIVIILSIFSSCGDDSTKPSTEDNSNTIDNSTTIDLSDFKEVSSIEDEDLLDAYREELSYRSSLDEYPSISDKEWAAISSEWDKDEVLERGSLAFESYSTSYNEISEYYYPIVFRNKNALILCYTDEYGNVESQKVYGSASTTTFGWVGNLHHDLSSDEGILKEDRRFAVTYLPESGKVLVWELGDLSATYTVPKNSIYCGFSFFEGYIFRNGGDVYAVIAVGSYNSSGKVSCIAHNVKYVVDADYYYSSDGWCQPLFHMEDGSLKVYLDWYKEEGVGSDHPSCLVDLEYEGSYDK